MIVSIFFSIVFCSNKTSIKWGCLYYWSWKQNIILFTLFYSLFSFLFDQEFLDHYIIDAFCSVWYPCFPIPHNTSSLLIYYPVQFGRVLQNIYLMTWLSVRSGKCSLKFEVLTCFLYPFSFFAIQAVVSFVTMQFQLCTVFFTFSLGTRTHYFGRTILHGGARVRFSFLLLLPGLISQLELIRKNELFAVSSNR